MYMNVSLYLQSSHLSPTLIMHDDGESIGYSYFFPSRFALLLIKYPIIHTKYSVV